MKLHEQDRIRREAKERLRQTTSLIQREAPASNSISFRFEFKY
jgi:hypothetical protein